MVSNSGAEPNQINPLRPSLLFLPLFEHSLCAKDVTRLSAKTNFCSDERGIGGEGRRGGASFMADAREEEG